MSLVGSLADLSLGDVLQIISLSQKSGVLRLRSRGNEGRLVFKNGLVHGACVRGEPQDLRTLLVKGGFSTQAIFDQAEADSRSGSTTVDEALARLADLSPEQLDSLRRESVEAAVFSMFRWKHGEFSFEVGVEPEKGSQLLLDRGINAQFLAMEAARLGDEDSHAEDAGAEAADLDPLAGFDGENTSPGPEEAPAEGSPQQTASDAGPAPAAGKAAPVAPANSPPPVVVIEPQLPALEWIKTTLAEQFPRVHIFQRTELGLSRIRQYLGRGEIPLLLLSSDAPADPLTGSGAADLALRLKRQVPRMTILWLAEMGREVESAGADGIVQRARTHEIGDPLAVEAVGRAAASLCEAVAEWARRGGA